MGWDDGKRMIFLAAVNAALMHILYPIIKRRVKRLRPFKVDPSAMSARHARQHSFQAATR